MTTGERMTINGKDYSYILELSHKWHAVVEPNLPAGYLTEEDQCCVADALFPLLRLYLKKKHNFKPIHLKNIDHGCSLSIDSYDGFFSACVLGCTKIVYEKTRTDKPCLCCGFKHGQFGEHEENCIKIHCIASSLACINGHLPIYQHLHELGCPVITSLDITTFNIIQMDRYHTEILAEICYRGFTDLARQTLTDIYQSIHDTAPHKSRFSATHNEILLREHRKGVMFNILFGADRGKPHVFISALKSGQPSMLGLMKQWWDAVALDTDDVPITARNFIESITPQNVEIITTVIALWPACARYIDDGCMSQLVGLVKMPECENLELNPRLPDNE
jgi:hypothetical protein